MGVDSGIWQRAAAAAVRVVMAVVLAVAFMVPAGAIEARAADEDGIDTGLAVDMGDEGYESVSTDMGKSPAGKVAFSLYPSDDALEAYQSAIGDETTTTKDMLTAWAASITSVTLDGIALEYKAFDEWKSELTNAADDASALLYYDTSVSSKYVRLILPIALFSTDHDANQLDSQTVVIEAEGFASVTDTVTYRNLGSDDFTVRVIDEESGDVLYTATLSDDELAALDVQQRYTTSANCGMAGLRSYTSEGVLLSDVLEAAGVTFSSGMTMQLRVNDELEANGGAETDEDGYITNGEFTYEELYDTARYHYPAMWDDETLYDELDGQSPYAVLAADMDAWKYGGAYEDELPAILSATKEQVEPIIAWSWAEGVVAWGGTDTTTMDYNGYCDQMNYRFLFGVSADDDGIIEDDNTTFSNCYALFGIDIIADESAIAEDDASEDDGDATLSFPDVVDGSWYASYVYALAADGLITGYTSGTYAGLFGVGLTMTRAQLATIVWRYNCPEEYAAYVASCYDAEQDAYTYASTTASSTCAGIADDTYWTAAADWCVACGVINGKQKADGSRYFDASGKLTLEELCQVLANVNDGTGSAKSLYAYTDGTSVSSWARSAVAWAIDNAIVGVDTSTLSSTAKLKRERVATVLGRVIYENDDVTLVVAD